MKGPRQPRQYALAAWEVYEAGRVVFRGNTALDYLARDRKKLTEELLAGAAEHAAVTLERDVEPGQVLITGFFPIP